MGEYEDVLANGEVERYIAAYAGRYDALDALWWLSHPLQTAPSGADAPAVARTALQAAAYSRDGGVEAQRALAEFEQHLSEDRAETVAAIAAARAPVEAPAAGAMSGPDPQADRVEHDDDPQPVATAAPVAHRWVAVAIGVAVVVVVAAVVVGRPFAVPSVAVPSATSVAPTPQATGVAEAAFASYVGDASCYNLLDVDTINRFGNLGYQNVSEEFEKTEAAEPNSFLAPFIDAGGLVCAWGESANSVYAYTPISSDDAANEKSKLVVQNFTKSKAFGAQVYSIPGLAYIFGHGYLAYYSDSAQDLTGQLVAHVPENAGAKRRDLQSAIYVTSEGVGDLRIGKAVPSGSKLVAWDADACPAGVGAWRAKKPFANDGTVAPKFDVLTAGGRRGGAVQTVLIYSPAIPTKSGIRVGDSRQEVEKAFPNIENSDYTLTGTAGKIRFEIGSIDPDHADEQVVLAILVTGVGGDFPFVAGDAAGACGA